MKLQRKPYGDTRQWVVFIDAPMTQPACVINGDAPKVKPLTQMVRHYGFPIGAPLAHVRPFPYGFSLFLPPKSSSPHCGMVHCKERLLRRTHSAGDGP